MQKKFMKTAKETAIAISQTLEKYRNYRYNKLQKKPQRKYMLFTPHVPLNNKGEIKKSLLKKAEDIALNDTELVPHFSQKTIEKIKNLLKIT